MIRLAADGITAKRGGVTLIEGISLTASGGEFIGLVGPNGAGKTTLLRALSGAAAKTEGRVAINGTDLRMLIPRERARRLAYLPQIREVAWAMTAEAVVALGRFAWGSPSRLAEADRAAVARALALTGAEALRTRTMPTLSGGEQARVHLARALAAEAPILLADEPTAALDPKHARAIMAALRAKADGGGLVMAASHDLRLAERWCTRIVVMSAGRIAADGPADLALTPPVMETVFGVGPSDL